MVQALINLARGAARCCRSRGVPLPLLSYGGSALIANLLAVRVLLACARREPERPEAAGEEGARGRSRG